MPSSSHSACARWRNGANLRREKSSRTASCSSGGDVGDVEGEFEGREGDRRAATAVSGFGWVRAAAASVRARDRSPASPSDPSWPTSARTPAAANAAADADASAETLTETSTSSFPPPRLGPAPTAIHDGSAAGESNACGSGGE